MQTFMTGTMTGTACALICALAMASPNDHDDDWDGHRGKPPIRLTIQAPDNGHNHGLTTNTGWSLVLRIDAPDAVAIVETPEEPTQPIGRREAIVLEDPDGCLDLRNFPITNPGRPYQDCNGPDETILEFTTERFDTFDLADSNTGNFQVRNQLLDESFIAGALLNKPYLRNTAGTVVAVPRPQTGGALLDGYGFGPDDDLPGLVLMSNLGAARAFDENFDRVPFFIRNMAGLVNTVSQELKTSRGGSALVATMQVAAGMFEPIALVDLDVDADGVDYLRRRESGPVQAFQFLAPPKNNDDVLRDITSSYSPFDIDVRAVLVEGVAPTFIEDKNRDGRYTATDLKLMGYRLLSNEVRLRQTVEFDLAVTETVSGRTCPPASLIYRDLDGNGRDGAITCSGSGGAGRIRRVPL